MKGTPMEHCMQNLFEGEIESVVRCTNIHFESVRPEKFSILQVPLQDSDTLEGAIGKMLAAEELTGDDKYEADEHGKQDAKKFQRLKSLPPVLQVNLNRFGMSKTGEFSKINSRCEF